MDKIMWGEYLKEVEERERKDRRNSGDELKISYIGEWRTDGNLFSDGTVLDHGVMWYFTTMYKYMCKLANIANYSGDCLVGYASNKMERCLELGCDWGHCFGVFDRFFEEVYGVEALGDIATIGADNGCKIAHALIEQTGFGDNYFDVVLSNHVLEHGISPEIVLGEVYRVTKPGGWSVHTLPCRVDRLKEPVSLIHKSILTDEEWERAFEVAGFIVRTSYYSWNHNQEEFNIVARKPA